MSANTNTKVRFRICRACGIETSMFQSIFWASLDHMLKSVTGLELSECDGLPQYICKACIQQLSRAFQFKELCIQLDTKFRSLAKQVEKPTEDNINPEQDNYSNSFIDDQEVSDNSDDNQPIAPCKEPDRSVELKLPEPPLKCTNMAKYVCNVCRKTFQELRVLLRHNKTHQPARYTCNECDRRFAEKSNLTKHLKSHTGELRNVIGKPHLCADCGKTFKWRTSLLKHQRHHTMSNVFQCTQCPKYYTEKKGLTMHMMSHRNERPHQCSYCDKQFIQKNHLDKHMRTHLGIKPFICSVCDRRYSCKISLVKHLLDHGQDKVYRCQQCSVQFTTHQAMAAHSKVHLSKTIIKSSNKPS